MNRGSCPEPSYGKQKISPGEFPGSVALTKPWKGVESTLPNQITEILVEAIKKEFLPPLALLVAILVAFVELKWFRRQFPVLAAIMVAVIIYVQYPSLWKEALVIALLCAAGGLLPRRG